MNICGKINLFVKERGKMVIYEGSISHKQQDGTYIKCSVECKFGNKEKFPKATLDKLKQDVCYTINVNDGFISVDSWEDKETKKTRRKLILVITDGKVEKATPVDTSKLTKEAKANLNKDNGDLPF